MGKIVQYHTTTKHNNEKPFAKKNNWENTRSYV